MSGTATTTVPLDQPKVVSHRRPASSFRLDELPVPHGREEEWRFTPMARVAPMFEDRASDTEAVHLEVRATQGVTVGTLGIGQAPRGTVLVPNDLPAGLASAHTGQALHLAVAPGAELGEPVLVTVTGRGASLRANSHIVIEAGQSSRAIVVLDHQGSAQFTGNVEIVVADNADLTVVSLQNWARDGLHTGQHEARVGRDAHFRHIVVTLGGDLVRLHGNVSYGAPGGTAELYGLYFADAGQHLEHRLCVDHNAPNTTSRVDYRGALNGAKARSVWIGDVLIRKQSLNIDTYEQNRNLLLSQGCRADSVPNLEIETGEIVGAGHSTSTGRFDEEQLFYLMSRGIGEDEARKLVVRGFFAEIIQRIGVPAVEQALTSAIDSELQSAEGAPAAAIHPAPVPNFSETQEN